MHVIDNHNYDGDGDGDDDDVVDGDDRGRTGADDDADDAPTAAADDGDACDDDFDGSLLCLLSHMRMATSRSHDTQPYVAASLHCLQAFVLIPFMEFLLPVALRIFPNMLPSTFKVLCPITASVALRVGNSLPL